MKVTVKFLEFIIMLVILTACSNEKSIDSSKLEVYILRHNDSGNDFVKDEAPIFTSEDISNYDWDTHTITFKKEFIKAHEITKSEDDLVMGGSKILGIYYPDQFAFYLDGEELYRGYIQPQAYISFMPGGPTISDSNDGIIINCLDDNSDTRENDKLLEFLKVNDLLK